MRSCVWLFFIEEAIWLYTLIPIFIALSLYFTYKLRFMQFRFMSDVYRSLFEKSPNSIGITVFQSFNLSMASRIGARNVIGVAFAISVGGPGSIFWLWVLAFLGMAITFIENTLAQVYKVKVGGNYQGGPAYYIKKGLRSPKLAGCMALILAIVFGFLFNAIQAHTIISAMNATYSVSTELVIAIVLIISGIVIFGGVRRIAHLTEIIVPLMIILYLGVVGYILLMNLPMIPELFSLIIVDAFGTTEFIGGAIGISIIEGVRNNIISNETGVGSASIAGAAANTKHPAKQGLMQSFGVFLDTIIISSASAFVILMSGFYTHGAPTNGILLVQASIAVHIGALAPHFITLVLLLFSITSIISNYYYGETNITYFSQKKHYIMLYRVAVLLMIFFGFMSDDGVLWTLIFTSMGMIGLINMICLFFLSGIAFKVWENYLTQRRLGIDPDFYASDIEGLVGTECWEGRRKRANPTVVEDPYFSVQGKRHSE